MRTTVNDRWRGILSSILLRLLTLTSCGNALAAPLIQISREASPGSSTGGLRDVHEDVPAVQLVARAFGSGGETRESVKKYLKKINVNKKHLIIFSGGLATTNEQRERTEDEQDASRYKRRNGGQDFRDLRTTAYRSEAGITSASPPNSIPFSLGMIDSAKGIVRIFGPPGGDPGSIYSEQLYNAIRVSMAKGRITMIYYMQQGATHPSQTVMREGPDGYRYRYRMAPSGAEEIQRSGFYLGRNLKLWKAGSYYDFDSVTRRPVVAESQSNPESMSLAALNAMFPPPERRRRLPRPAPGPAPRPAPRPPPRLLPPPRGPLRGPQRLPAARQPLRIGYVPSTSRGSQG